MLRWLQLTLMAAVLGSAITAIPGQGRIIGGSIVDINVYPWLISLRVKTGENSPYQHRCAGMIYSEKVCITAAQCIAGINSNDRVIVVAGANTRTGADGRQYPVAKFIAHPDYSFWTVDYDVGILILAEAFDFTYVKTQPIQIFTNRPANGRIGTMAGWGYREEYGPSSYYLEHTKVPIVSHADCVKAYGEGEITDRMICAGYLESGGKDGCQGDTGGPLVVNGEAVGALSWGRGCARPGYPSVYARLAPLKSWIDKTIAANVH